MSISDHPYSIFGLACGLAEGLGILAEGLAVITGVKSSDGPPGLDTNDVRSQSREVVRVERWPRARIARG